MKNIIEKYNNLIQQILKFGVVGVVSTIIDFAILYVLTNFLGIHYLLSATISFLVSLVFNYILSIIWVFDVKKKQTYKEVLLFSILSLIGLGINEVIMYLGTDILNIHYMISKLGATGVVMVWNFVTRKIFIEK